MKAQASVRVDVPTAPFFYAVRKGVQRVCKFLCETRACQASDRDLENVRAVKKVNAWICSFTDKRP